MNIGLITPYYPSKKTSNSGIANHFYLLAEALTNLGHKVVVLHVRPIEENEIAEDEIFNNKGVTYILCKIALPEWVKSVAKNKWAQQDFYQKVAAITKTSRKLKKIVKAYNLQIIETSSYFSLCYLYLFNVNAIPVVTRVSTTYKQMMTNHYPYKSRLGNVIADLEYLMIKKSQNIITHSNNHLEEIKKIFNLGLKNCGIIPHGISLPLIKEEKQPSSFIKVLFVGRMESRKGIDILLDAIPSVLQTTTNVIFNLVGDNYIDYQADFHKKNGISEGVHFLGNVDESQRDELYTDCDIFVAPSRYESFGLIYIEAMGYGKPVIGCRVGGVIDVINDHVNGLFAELNPHDLASKILILAQDKTLRENMGKAARQKVIEKYTKEIMAESSLTYYSKILNIN